MTTSVSPEQRFTEHHPCPICGGHNGLPSGRGHRCYGYLSSDEHYAHCTRDEYAGGLRPEAGGTYAHFLDGPCRCGETHGSAPVAVNGRRAESAPQRVYRDYREAGAVCAYDYTDESGAVLFQVWRYANPKGFKQARPVSGGWGMGISGVRRVLYRLPDLLAADLDEWLLLCEGEKDADAAIALGFTATTNAMGAKKWNASYSDALRGRRVCQMLDNDNDGEQHGQIVGHALAGVAREHRLLRLPGVPLKGDLCDWLDADGTPEALRALIEQAPRWSPVQSGNSDNDSDSDSDSENPDAVHGANSQKQHRPYTRLLTFRGGDEIASLVGSETRMIAPYLFQDAITEFDGAIKTSGKTTLVTHLCRAVIDGEPFLGVPTVSSPIVYLSEQSVSSFTAALRRAGLLDEPRFRYILYGETLGVSWPEVVLQARDEAARVGARIIIADTLSQWADLRGDDENSAGAALAAMAPLQAAVSEDHHTVGLIRHDKIAGGALGKSARGSSAFGGVVDVIARMRLPDNAARPTLRIVEAIGRFDGIPDIVTVELTPDGYELAGDTDAAGSQEARFALAKHLPRSETDAVTEQDLIEASGVSRTTVRLTLDEYRTIGFLRETGDGVRGDPKCYWFPLQVDEPSHGQTAFLTTGRSVSETKTEKSAPRREKNTDTPKTAVHLAALPDSSSETLSETLSETAPDSLSLPPDCGAPESCQRLGPCHVYREHGQCWAARCTETEGHHA